MKLDDLKHMIRQELAASIKSIVQEKQMMREKTVNPWKPPREMTPAEIKDRDRIGKEMLKDPNAVAVAKKQASEAGEPQEWESYLWAMATSQAIEDSDAAAARGQARAAKKSKNAALNKKGDVPSWKKQKDKRAAAKTSSEPPKADKEPEKAPEPPKEEPKSDAPSEPKKKRPPMKISGKKLKKAVMKKKLAKKTPTKKKVDPKMKAKAKKISKAKKFKVQTAGFPNHPLAKKQKSETTILTSETQA